MPSRLQATINQYKADLMRHEAKAQQYLDYAHQQTLKMIDAKLQGLYDQMSAAMQDGAELSPSWLYEANRLENISQYISGAVDHFGALAQMTTAQQQQLGVQLGMSAGKAMLGATVPPGVSWSFGMPSSSAIAGMVGATQAGSPLADLFSGFGAEAAQKASHALISGVTLGYNPREITHAVSAILDISRNRALTIARTEMLRSYRDANTATYQANSDVVDQWRWTCDLSSRTCAACLAMDGTLHDLDETLDSHPCCRCTPVPVTKSWDEILGNAGIDASGIEDTNPASDMQSGADWFDSQSADTQQSILGKSAYQLYANGDVTLKDFVGHSSSKDWGNSIYQKPVKELVKK